MRGAPRLPARLWHGLTRGAWLASGLWLAGAAAAQEQVSVPCAGTVKQASYTSPTGRYPHGVLGDRLEWGGLRVTWIARGDCPAGRLSIALPETLVFEDVAPRLAQLDRQGPEEIVVVESHADAGARLAVWGFRDGRFERLTATPFIGQRFRWLAPLGAADLDGDGAVELAYVDRPHLAKTLRIWRYLPEGPRLEEVASHAGVTNHRIGETDIAGGIRDCGDGPEMIVADAAWQEVLALRFDGREISQQGLGPHRGRESFARAMTCQPLR